MHTAIAATLAVAALGALAVPARASDASASAAVEAAVAAMDRGHGTMCSLAAEPVVSGGYWPCVDVGPYRFVREYGRVRGFVVLKGQAPFQILVADERGADFTVTGRWTRDLGPRVAAWWDEEVLGGRRAREDAAGDDGRRAAAEAALGGPDAGTAPAGAADSGTPVPAGEPEPAPRDAVPAPPAQAAQPSAGGSPRDRPIPALRSR